MKRIVILAVVVLSLAGAQDAAAKHRTRPDANTLQNVTRTGIRAVSVDDIYQWSWWTTNNVAYPNCWYVASVTGAACVGAGVDSYSWVPGWEHIIANVRAVWRNNYGGNYYTCRRWYWIIKDSTGKFSNLGANGSQFCNWLV